MLIGDSESVTISRQLVSTAAAPRDLLAALHDTGVRQRVHGVAMMVVGAAVLATVLMTLDEGLATIVGAGIAAYGVYLSLR